MTDIVVRGDPAQPIIIAAGPRGPAGPAGPPGPPGAGLDVQAPTGSFAVWNADTHTVEFIPASAVMRTGQVGLGADDTTASVPDPDTPPPALFTLTDAGSYYFPHGIAAEDCPPDAQAGQPYVLAVTSSPSTAGDADQDQQTYQSGIQILTLLNDPARVWRRGFSTSDPVAWTDWVLSGAAAAATTGLAAIQGTLTDPTELPEQGSYPGEAWLVAGDLWVWR